MPVLNFLKMHGCGNDFVVFDDPQGDYPWEALSSLAPQLCDRRFSIGADGLIAVGHGPLSGEKWPDGTDYEMRYVNADGSRAEMCGNGIRCLGKFAAEQLGDPRNSLQILTGNGVLPIVLERHGDEVTGVTVNMGRPQLAPPAIPTTLGQNAKAVVGEPLAVAGTRLAVTAVNMGNPHAVCFVVAITDEHVNLIGPAVERHAAFPAKTNVEFVQVESPRSLRMRVWERGCGETWACGTGACASVVAAVLNGRAAYGSDIKVKLNGGDLSINWPAADSPIFMTGPATTVYAGSLEVAARLNIESHPAG